MLRDIFIKEWHCVTTTNLQLIPTPVTTKKTAFGISVTILLERFLNVLLIYSSGKLGNVPTTNYDPVGIVDRRGVLLMCLRICICRYIRLVSMLLIINEIRQWPK